MRQPAPGLPPDPVLVRDSVNRAVSYLDYFCRHTTRPPRLALLPLDPFGPGVEPDAVTIVPVQSLADDCGVTLVWAVTTPDGPRATLVLPQAPPARGLLPWRTTTPVGPVTIAALDDLADLSRQLPPAPIVLVPAREGYAASNAASDRARPVRAVQLGAWVAVANLGPAITHGADGTARRRFTSRGRSSIHDPRGHQVTGTDGPGEAVILAAVTVPGLVAAGA